MAAHASALAEQIFAVVDRMQLHVAAGQHHVGRMAGLAARLRILFGIQRPQPVLVIPVRLLDAGGGASVALMAGRAAELVRIVNLQKFRLGMTDERVRIFIRLLLAFCRHRGRVILIGSRVSMWQDSQRSTMFASATLICTIVGSQSAALLLQSVNLLPGSGLPCDRRCTHPSSPWLR